MIDITTELLFGSFVAGVFMFLAPCTLPLIPAYLAFISGVSEREVAHVAKRRIVGNAVAFVIGFSIIFILFGMLAGFFGTFAGSLREILVPIGGVFIIIFGLLMLNVFRLPILSSTHQVRLPAVLKPGNPVAAGAIGATFALGWSPCIGPVLATILLLASVETTVLSGGFLLFVFSFGLAIPFIITAYFYATVSRTISRYSRFSTIISFVGGVILIAVGILLLFDAFGAWVNYGTVLFGWFGFEALYEFY